MLFGVKVEDDDPNIIHDEAYETTTPASRTKAALDAHLWARHPAEARALQIQRLAEPSRTVLEQVIDIPSLPRGTREGLVG